MKQPLTKTEIYKNISEICEGDTILQNQKIEDTWTINSLLYCLEWLDYDYGVHVDINTTYGMYIPVRKYNDPPVFIPASIRNKKAIITDVESYPVDTDDEENYIYLFIIKEV